GPSTRSCCCAKRPEEFPSLGRGAFRDALWDRLSLRRRKSARAVGAGAISEHRPFLEHDHVGNAQRFGPRKYVVKRLRILIVEDDAMVAMVLADMLVDQQHEICGIATTESDAVNAAARCKPDMMIVDVRLRAGSGVAALEAI